VGGEKGRKGEERGGEREKGRKGESRGKGEREKGRE
jgi:hypothetical protein